MRQKLQTVDVIVGDFAGNFGDELLPGCIESALGVKMVRLTVWDHERQILDAVAATRYHLGVLVVNNIVFEGVASTDFESRLVRALNLLKVLHEQYQIPVFILSGPSFAQNIVERALQAGASWASLIPCELEALRAALVAHLELTGSKKSSFRAGRS